MPSAKCMMMLSNGNIFRFTGPLCGEVTGGQWRGALMFSLICTWINGCVINRKAGDLRRHRAHYDVIVIEGHFVPDSMCPRSLSIAIKWGNVHWICVHWDWWFKWAATVMAPLSNGRQTRHSCTQIARFMGPTWGPSGADRTQVGPVLTPWTLLSG